jgi:hypothetical protein
MRVAFLVVLTALVLPAPVSFVFGASCDDWTHRRAFDTLPPLEKVLSSDVSVHKSAFLPAGFSGLALSPGVVVLKPGASYQTLAHELAHTFQMKTDGMVAYSTRYVYDWYVGLWHGCSLSDARHAISYELQAEAVGDLAESAEYNKELWSAWAYAVEPPGVYAASSGLFERFKELVEASRERQSSAHNSGRDVEADSD